MGDVLSSVSCWICSIPSSKRTRMCNAGQFGDALLEVLAAIDLQRRAEFICARRSASSSVWSSLAESL